MDSSGETFPSWNFIASQVEPQIRTVSRYRKALYIFLPLGFHIQHVEADYTSENLIDQVKRLEQSFTKPAQFFPAWQLKE